MATKDLHLEVLKLMERARKGVDAFYYGNRVANSPRARVDRIQRGYVFLGDERYIWVPVCPLSVPENNTKAVGIVFEITDDCISKSWLEVVVPTDRSTIGRKDPSVAVVLQKLIGMRKRLGLPEPDTFDTKAYHRSAMVISDRHVLGDTERWLLAHLKAVLKCLSGGRMTMIYTQELMAKCLKRFLNARNNIGDDVGKMVQQVYESVC